MGDDFKLEIFPKLGWVWLRLRAAFAEKTWARLDFANFFTSLEVEQIAKGGLFLLQYMVFFTILWMKVLTLCSNHQVAQGYVLFRWVSHSPPWIPIALSLQTNGPWSASGAERLGDECDRSRQAAAVRRYDGGKPRAGAVAQSASRATYDWNPKNIPIVPKTHQEVWLED